jgi:hypothetical protein
MILGSGFFLHSLAEIAHFIRCWNQGSPPAPREVTQENAQCSGSSASVWATSQAVASTVAGADPRCQDMSLAHPFPSLDLSFSSKQWRSWNGSWVPRLYFGGLSDMLSTYEALGSIPSTKKKLFWRQSTSWKISTWKISVFFFSLPCGLNELLCWRLSAQW